MSDQNDSRDKALVAVLAQVRDAVEYALGNTQRLSVEKVTVTLQTTLTGSGSAGPTINVVEINASGELKSEHIIEVAFAPKPKRLPGEGYVGWPDDLADSVRAIETALEATEAGYQTVGLEVSEATITLSFSVDAGGGIKIFGIGGSVEREAVHKMELALQLK